jgi:flagellar biosynthesis/type III secretory pathway M-ring protein FliF/YscJ
MAAALELLVLPAILLTLIALLLLKSSFGAAGIVATVVFLGLLYFVIVKLLRQMRRWDHEQQVSSYKAFKQAEREGEQAERETREQLKHEAEQAEREAHHPA